MKKRYKYGVGSTYTKTQIADNGAFLRRYDTLNNVIEQFTDKGSWYRLDHIDVKYHDEIKKNFKEYKLKYLLDAYELPIGGDRFQAEIKFLRSLIKKEFYDEVLEE